MEDTTILSLLRELISSWPRGRIFFLEDFSEEINDAFSVRKFLCTLVEEGFVVRLARGIYCYPLLTAGEYSVHFTLPSDETVAETYAARENVRIIPYGDKAAADLGLGSMVVSHLKYLTDGSPRVINLRNGRKIHFNHTSEVKMFAFRSVTMQKLSSAIRAYEKGRFDNPSDRRKIHAILKEVSDEDYAADLKIMPAWVAEFVDDVRNR